MEVGLTSLHMDLQINPRLAGQMDLQCQALSASEPVLAKAIFLLDLSNKRGLVRCLRSCCKSVCPYQM